MLAAVLLAVLLVATAVHWARHPATARSYIGTRCWPILRRAADGAVTVGAGRCWRAGPIGLRAAVDADWVLWLPGPRPGCDGGRRGVPDADPAGPSRPAFGGWLMPVVPPMVSASAGALLIPHAAAGPPRLALLVCCYAMFGLSLLASAVVIGLIAAQLAAGQWVSRG